MLDASGQRGVESKELQSAQLEQFMPIAQFERIVKGVLDQKVNAGRTLNDLYSNEGAEIESIDDVYSCLTGLNSNLHFTNEGLTNFKRSYREMAESLNARILQQKCIAKLNDDQLHKALYIQSAKETSGQVPLATETRIYPQCGVDGLHVAKRLLELDVPFDYMKLWLPSQTTEVQQFRKDVPVVAVSTVDQLHSVIDSLRVIQEEGFLFEGEVLAGLAIEGLSGVSIAQTEDSDSFNFKMAEVLAGPIRESVQQACSGAGDMVTNGLVAAVSDRARSKLYNKAAAQGINPSHHALIKGQSLQQIKQAIS